MTRVCLNMIVKDEARVIERCLRSVRPFIDSWVIVDTGSTDGTQDRIRELMGDMPGRLHERPWKNFGHNRTEAIELAREFGEYLFIIDADEVLHLPLGYQRPHLSGTSYAIEMEMGAIRYGRVCVINASLPWRYVGVLHEYLDCGQVVKSPTLPGVRAVVHTDGGRSHGITVADKYARDALQLERALIEEPGNARYVFYLAQSYRDSAQPQPALLNYERRAQMGGWIEEVWYALYSAALLAEQLGHEHDAVVGRYMKAYEARPARGGEALGQLARYCREAGQFAMARLFAEKAMSIPMPDDALFVDTSWYRWRADDEYAISSYWTAHYDDSRRVCEELLSSSELPATQRPRVLANLNFALDKLGLQAGAKGHPSDSSTG